MLCFKKNFLITLRHLLRSTAVANSNYIKKNRLLHTCSEVQYNISTVIKINLQNIVQCSYFLLKYKERPESIGGLPNVTGVSSVTGTRKTGVFWDPKDDLKRTVYSVHPF